MICSPIKLSCDESVESEVPVGHGFVNSLHQKQFWGPFDLESNRLIR